VKSAADFEKAFELYFEEMEACARSGCYWALLHMVVTLPDVCAALEHPEQPSSVRFVTWCAENFSTDGRLGPLDRFQLRNAVLHEGTTLPTDRSRTQTKPTQYSSFSFVEPGQDSAGLHCLVNEDPRRSGKNLTINYKHLADETQGAMRRWFGVLAGDPARSARVEANLGVLARRQRKLAAVPVELPPGSRGRRFGRIEIVIAVPTTSST
jgi:hypothetical protein